MTKIVSLKTKRVRLLEKLKGSDSFNPTAIHTSILTQIWGVAIAYATNYFV